MSNIKEGSKVKWKWGNGWAEGKVKSIFAKKITRKIKGSEISRNGSKENPALYIEQENGDHVLKLESEVSKT